MSASGGFNLVRKELPYALDDLIAEPTQKRLQQSAVKYVPFLSGDNTLLDQLFSGVANSPTLGAIIEQKTAYTVGGGFYAQPTAANSILPSLALEAPQLDTRKAIALNDWLQSVNPQDETITELSEKVVRSLWSFGNAFIEVCKWTVSKEKKFSLQELPVYLCRPKKAEKNKIWPEFIGVSEEFQEDQLNPPNVKDYPIFPNFKEIQGKERSIIHIKMARPNFYYWGAPDWLAARLYVEHEYRIPKFNQSKFENGFMPSALITIKGQFTNEEGRRVINKMRDTFTQTGNNSKMFVQVLRDESAAADVQVLNNQEEGEFMNWAQQVKEQIVTGCRWTHSLAGMKTAGSLGTNQQILAEFDIVHKTVIKPLQDLYLKHLNKALAVAGSWLGTWDGISLGLNKSKPLSLATQIDPTKVMTQNEQREVLGLPPLDQNLEDATTV